MTTSRELGYSVSKSFATDVSFQERNILNSFISEMKGEYFIKDTTKDVIGDYVGCTNKNLIFVRYFFQEEIYYIVPIIEIIDITYGKNSMGYDRNKVIVREFKEIR